jgi:integrase
MWKVTVTDNEGAIVESQTYASEASAKSHGRQWPNYCVVIKRAGDEVVSTGGPRGLKTKINTVAKAIAQGNGRYAFGGSLFLTIKGGSALWEYQFREGKKSRTRGLGSAIGPLAVSLSEARERRAQLWLERRMKRDASRRGASPFPPSFPPSPAVEQALRWLNASQAMGRPALAQPVQRLSVGPSPTFAEVADGYQRKNAEAWSAGHCRTVKALLARTAALAPMPVAEITSADVVQVLEPIWQGASRSTTGSRLRGLIEQVFTFGKVRPNPAAWEILKGELAGGKVKSAAHPSLPYHELPALMKELADNPSMQARAIRFVILTASREQEAIGARWGEIDIANRLWIVPSNRMKMGIAHRVPLSESALSLLGEPGTPDAFVFPSARAAHVGHSALHQLLRKAGRIDPMQGKPITLHGFRSTFASFAQDNGFPADVRAYALAHKEADAVRAAYERSDLLPARRKLMNEWARFATNAQENLT